MPGCFGQLIHTEQQVAEMRHQPGVRACFS
jgi:hypothetical protein